MIGLEIWAKIELENRLEFLQTFELKSADRGVIAGCTERILFEKVGHANQFLWLEHWNSAEELAVYRQSEQHRSLLGAIEVLGALVKIQTHMISKE